MHIRWLQFSYLFLNCTRGNRVQPLTDFFWCQVLWELTSLLHGPRSALMGSLEKNLNSAFSQNTCWLGQQLWSDTGVFVSPRVQWYRDIRPVRVTASENTMLVLGIYILFSWTCKKHLVQTSQLWCQEGMKICRIFPSGSLLKLLNFHKIITSFWGLWLQIPSLPNL